MYFDFFLPDFQAGQTGNIKSSNCGDEEGIRMFLATDWVFAV